MPKSINRCLFLVTLLVTVSCSMPKLFQVVINQGNLIDKEMLSKLEVGMTESQVKYILGTPLISDTFTPERWDYYTSISQGSNVFREIKVTLYFDDGELVKWEGDLPPEEG